MKRRLWEQDDLHCSIIGTCLSLDELKRLARQLDVDLAPGLSEYMIHGAFVGMSRRCSPEAKAIEKLLNRKYSGIIARFARARDDEALRELWNEAREQGNIPGPYWALLCNPHGSQQLRAEVFGEVHMLSHLVGAANRADIKRLRHLEDQCASLRDGQAHARARSRRRIRALERENTAKKETIRSMAKELETLRQHAKILAPDAMRAENRALEQTLAAQVGHINSLERANAELQRRAQAFERLAGRAARDADAKDAEIRFLEAELARAAVRPCAMSCGCADAGTEDCPGPALCGKRILYVGGRANLVRHYREMVERMGGEFRHHDGGVEESSKRLPNLVSGVDAVVCPLDCVSHDACSKVKTLCRNGLKELKLLPSSGLSSLAQCLEELVGATPETHRTM